MDGSSNLGRLETRQWDQLQDMASRFEAAWKESDTVDLSAFLPPPGNPLRRVVLHELIKSDLEARWQRGQIIGLEAYLEKFPELGTPALIAPALIYEEYRVRHLHGDKPQLAGYERRFPRQFPELQRLVGEEPVPTAKGDAPEPPSEMKSLPPNQILRIGGGFKLIKRIGCGGFAEVWQAETPGGFPVAIKRLLRPLDHAEAQLELRALGEIKRLSHPYLLQTRDFDLLDNRLYIVMDLADCTLSDRLHACKQAGMQGIPLNELLRYIHEAAEALDYMHGEKVHHRDIKPKNILLHKGHAKVADFGLARVVETQRLTVTGSGTAPYMAPEVWRRQVSSSSDQYSLAVTYTELRLGRLPFSSTDMYSLMMEHLEGQPNLDPLPEAEQQVLRKGLSKEPAERYLSCLAFVQALEQALETPPEREEPPSKRHRRSTSRRAIPSGSDRTMVPGDTPPQPLSSSADTVTPVPPPRWPLSRTRRGPSWVLLAMTLGVLVGIIAWKLLTGRIGDFQVEPPEPFTVKVGKSGTFELAVLRSHFDGPITLSGSEHGVTLFGSVASGADSAEVSYQIAPEADIGEIVVPLHMEAPGHATRDLSITLNVEPAYWKDNWKKVPESQFEIDANGRRHYSEIDVMADGIPVRFILIPQRFDNERGQKDLPTYYIMKHKVWNALYAGYAKAEPHKAGTTWQKGGIANEEDLGVGMGREQYPALRMTWPEAHCCAVWLGGLIPTLEQWDKASGYYEKNRGKGPFVEPPGREQGPKGPVWRGGEIAINRKKQGPMPVGQATFDESPYHCRDMAGNGYEWTRRYAGLSQPTLPLKKVNPFDEMYLRGCPYGVREPLRFEDHDQGKLAVEKYLEPKPNIGFRVVIELD
jgi:serine/threonine protein kinase